MNICSKCGFAAKFEVSGSYCECRECWYKYDLYNIEDADPFSHFVYGPEEEDKGIIEEGMIHNTIGKSRPARSVKIYKK